MVEFNELQINPKGTCVVIDAQIKDDIYFNDVYIEAIIIDTKENYSASGPSSTPIFKKEYKDKPKRVKLNLTTNDFASIKKVCLNKEMLFVYVIAGGIPSPTTPCGEDNNINIQPVINLYPLYQQAMNYVSELADSCNYPSRFVDYILNLKALELALKTGNFNTAISQWDKLIKITKNSNIKLKSGCGCHG